MTSKSLGYALVVAGVTTVSCGGQVGEETAVCEAVSRTPLSLDDPTPLGFTAGELLGATMGAHAAALTWADGATTSATVELSYAEGSAEFLVREWIDDSGRELAAFDCSDVVRIGAELAVASADGALAESWEVHADATSAAELSLSRELSPLGGSLAIEDFAPEGEWAGMRAWIDLRVSAQGPAGAIVGQAHGEDGELAFAQGFDIAVIGAAP